MAALDNEFSDDSDWEELEERVRESDFEDFNILDESDFEY